MQTRQAVDPRDQTGPFVYELCGFPVPLLPGVFACLTDPDVADSVTDGVSNHSGSLSGGHCTCLSRFFYLFHTSTDPLVLDTTDTAFVKSARRHWKYCDDRTISEADEKDLVVRLPLSLAISSSFALDLPLPPVFFPPRCSPRTPTSFSTDACPSSGRLSSPTLPSSLSPLHSCTSPSPNLTHA